VVAAYALELDGARRAEARLPALEAAQDASFPVRGTPLQSLSASPLHAAAMASNLLRADVDQTPACGLDLAEMLRQAVGDPGVSRLDAGAVALEVVSKQGPSCRPCRAFPDSTGAPAGVAQA